MGRLKKWQESIDALSLRERAAVLFGLLIVIYFAWDMVFMQPLIAKEKRTTSFLQQRQSEKNALSSQLQSIAGSNLMDPDRANMEKLQSLKSELKKIEEQLNLATRQLISPGNMARMLESVLYGVRGLRLLKVSGLGSEPVLATRPVEGSAGGGVGAENNAGVSSLVDNAYKHGLRIEFEGDYMNTLAYIQELEKLEWSFFWESLDLEVLNYPTSKIGITVFTLSLDRNWIGV